MRWSCSLAVLLTSILVTAPLPAQKGGGGARGGGVSAGNGPGFGGHPGPGAPNGSFPRRFPRHQNAGRYFAPYYPFWGDDLYWDDELYLQSGDEPYSGPAVNLTSPPRAVLESSYRCSPAAQAAMLEPPKLIEIPQVKDAPAAKPLPPTLFVLANGEQLEAHRYLVTATSLYVAVGRQERTIPLRDLDLSATVASNLKRGIDLKLPANGNEVFLGF